MTTEQPSVTVIIPCRNEEAFVDACLAMLVNGQDYTGALEFLIAEGRSGDGTRASLERWARKDSRVRVIDNPEGIVPTGLNRCIQAAHGAVILRADVHSIYARDYISATVQELVRTGADNVGGAARPVGDASVQVGFAYAVKSPLALGGASSRDAEREGWVDTVQYGCWWRSLFDRVGMFDPAFVRNQDDELNLRISSAGGRIWQSKRIVSYLYPRKSLRALFSQYFQYGYWKVRVIRKHRRPASPRHLMPAAFVALVVASVIAALAYPAAIWLTLGAVGLHCLVIAGESIRIARNAGASVIAMCALVMVTLHWSYGTGFLLGLLRSPWQPVEASPLPPAKGETNVAA